MKQTWIQLDCDYCNSTDYHGPSHWREASRENGWVLTGDGKHYCSRACYNYAKGSAKQQDREKFREIMGHYPD